MFIFKKTSSSADKNFNASTDLRDTATIMCAMTHEGLV